MSTWHFFGGGKWICCPNSLSINFFFHSLHPSYSLDALISIWISGHVLQIWKPNLNFFNHNLDPSLKFGSHWENILTIVRSGFPRYLQGYIPNKSKAVNSKNSVSGLNYAKHSSILSLFAVFSDFLSLQTVKTVNTKTANSEGRLYVFFS